MPHHFVSLCSNHICYIPFSFLTAWSHILGLLSAGLYSYKILDVISGLECRSSYFIAFRVYHTEQFCVAKDEFHDVFLKLLIIR